MGRAIILSRVSSHSQDLEQQTEEVLKEVRKDGYQDKDIIIIEDKESAIKLSEEERHGLNQMKDNINRDSSIEVVYIYELSRLSRRQLVLFSIRDYLVERKIQLICLKPYFKLLENDSTMSQTGSLMFSIFSSMSESEMMLKKERMMRGRRHNIAMGKSGGGRCPFGYTTDKEKRYIVNPEQAAVLKRIFKDYAESGKSLMMISRELKEEGLFPNTSLYTLRNEVNNWLKKTFYTGNSQFPQIISKAIFAQAQRSLASNRIIHKNNHKEKFLLKGLIRDGNTGYLLSGNSHLDSYYSKRHSGCTISRLNIDPIVWLSAKKMYNRFVVNKHILRKQLNKDLDTITKKINTTKEDIKSIQERIDKVEERMIYGKLSITRAEELAFNLSEQLSEKERRLSELVNLSITKTQQIFDVDFTEEIDEANMTIEEQIAIVRRVVDMVAVSRPTRTIAVVKIYNKINDNVEIYEVDCWKHEWRKAETLKRKDAPFIPANNIRPKNLSI